MRFFFTVLSILTIIFLPIPIKINIIFENNELIVKLYNKKIYTLYTNLKKNSSKKTKRKRAKVISKYKKYKRRKFSIKCLLRKLDKSKFKPILKLKAFLNFGLEDSAACAILYGLLCNSPYILRILLSRFANVKKLNLSIKPIFNINTLFFNISSIFYVSIANIIYILYLILKCFEIIEKPNKREEKIYG